MYKKIINPNTGKALSIDKPGGITVLKKYLEVIDMQVGGDDNKKDKGKDIEKAVKNKGGEIAEEIIDGPKEVANFFGKNIKKGFSGLFKWGKKKSSKKNLSSLDERMIKNIFDSDESKEADKKFASTKAAQLAADNNKSVHEIAQALLTMGQERTSEKGWTKMEVKIALRFIESWDKKHDKKWSELVNHMKKKKIKKKGLLAWLSKKTGQARESLLGWASDTRAYSNAKESVQEFSGELEKKIQTKEEELGKINEKIKTLESGLELGKKQLEEEKKKNSEKTQDLENLKKDNDNKQSQIDTLKQERNIAISTTKDNVVTINQQHKENLNLKKKNIMLQKENVPKNIHLHQRNEANRKIGKANKKIRKLIKEKMRLKEIIERRGYDNQYDGNKLKLDYQDNMLDLNYEMKQFNNNNNNTQIDLNNKQAYVARKNQIKQQRKLLSRNKDNSEFLINVFDEDDLIKTQQEYAVKRAYSDSKKPQNEPLVNENDLDDDIYEHNKSIHKGATSIIVDKDAFNKNMTPGDVIMIQNDQGEPDFNVIKEVQILNESDQVGGGVSRYFTLFKNEKCYANPEKRIITYKFVSRKDYSQIGGKSDPIKYRIIFEKPFERRHENPDLIIATGSRAFASFEKIGRINVGKWLKDKKNASDKAASDQLSSEKAALDLKIKNAEAEAVKKELESNELIKLAKKLQAECEGKDPSSDECKKADEAKNKADIAVAEAKKGKDLVDSLWDIGKAAYSGDYSKLKQFAEEKTKESISKKDNQKTALSMAMKYAAPAAGVAAVAGLGLAGKKLYNRYLKNNFFNKMYQLIDYESQGYQLGGSFFSDGFNKLKKFGTKNLGNLSKLGKRGIEIASKAVGDSSKNLSKIKNSTKYGKSMNPAPYQNYRQNLSTKIPNNYKGLKKYLKDTEIQNKIYNLFRKIDKEFGKIELHDKKTQNIEEYRKFRDNIISNKSSIIEGGDDTIKNFIDNLFNLIESNNPNYLNNSSNNPSSSSSSGNTNNSSTRDSQGTTPGNSSVQSNASSSRNFPSQVSMSNSGSPISPQQQQQQSPLVQRTVPQQQQLQRQLQRTVGGALYTKKFEDTNCFLNDDHGGRLILNHLFRIKNAQYPPKEDNLDNLEEYLEEKKLKKIVNDNPIDALLSMEAKSFYRISKIKFKSPKEEIDFIDSMIISYGPSFHYIYLNNTDNYIYNLITNCNYNGKNGWHRVETSSNSVPPNTKVENIDKDDKTKQIAEKIVKKSKNSNEKLLIIYTD